MRRRARTAGRGVLTIRASLAGGPAPGLLVRVTHTSDILAEPPVTDLASSVEEACRIVQRWLEEVVRRA